MMAKVARFLADREDLILEEACAALSRAHLPGYERAGAEVTGDRLRALHAMLIRCVEHRRLAPIVDQARRIAEERSRAGFDLGQVQIAFNVLEEAIWRAMLTDLPAEEQGEALGVVATILGAGKDALACAYVSLAAGAPTRSLDLSVLFRGPSEGEAPQP